MENFGFLEWLIIFIVVAIPIIALIDILKSDFTKSVNKIVWIIVVLFIPILGSILYFVIGKKQKKSQ